MKIEVETRFDEYYLAAIDAALATLSLEPVVHAAWRKELLDSARSGWFEPTIVEEMSEALTALRDGKSVPDFPRSG